MNPALSAALSGIADASTAVLTVLGALMVYGALVYGYRYVLNTMKLPNPGFKG